MTESDDDDERSDRERPTVSIPKFKRGDEVVEWAEVDAEYWDHVQRAQDVHETVVERYRDEPGVLSIENTRGEETIAGRATSVITVLVADEATAERLTLLDELDGVPIRAEVLRRRDTA